MTALGKGRVGKRKHKEPVYMSEEEEDDDDSVQDESVTRCTCGESHSVGLMVQCDQCEVWQHCECMGLMEERDIPEQYYCEECKPSDHIEIKIGFEKTRRYYKPALPSDFEKKLALPRRRTTFNSREASDSWEEILALQTALEQSKAESQSPKSPPLQQFKENNTEQESDEIEAESSSPRTGTVRQKRPLKKPKLNQTKKTAVSTEKKVKATGRKTNNNNNNNATTRPKKPTPRSRTSTPQPTPPSPALIEPLAPFVRETSPPAKVRFPSARMTIPDMSRRANHILEYICSIQVGMATRDDDDSESELDAQISEAMTRAVMQMEEQNESCRCRRRPTPILIPERPESSPSSSLSSASTLPLEEDDHPLLNNDDGERGVAEEALDRMRNKEQTSMEIMDILTRDVINFQRKFGALGGYDSGESDSGPTTRSRELSHRSLMDRPW